MKKYNMITPEGTKDILFEECIEKRNIQKCVTEVFNKRGYNEVITPGIEYYDVFDLEDAGIPQYEMYKSTDNHGRLIVFRPDLTLPIARLTATRLQNVSLPIRLFYNQTIWRNRPDLSGRSDESTQAGIELIGAAGIRADLEVISAAVEALSVCLDNFRIEIGHAAIFRILADKLPIADDLKEEIRTTIESKNYAALSDLLANVEHSPYVEAIKRLPQLFGGEEVFDEASKYCTDCEVLAVLDYLRRLYKSLEKLGLGDRIIVDLGLVQRNDYYSGVVFSAYAYGHGDAVVLGGRYDKLLGKFGNPMPAVGFAIDIDAVTSILLRDKKPVLPKPDVLVHADDGFEIEAQMRINQLIAQGLTCENSVFASREDAEVYKAQRQIDRIVFIGENGNE